MGNLLIILLVLCLIVIVLFWYFFHNAFAKIDITTKSEVGILPPVTVIVCYKNARQHVLTTIQHLLDQQYHDFELIAIDDFSSDGGSDLLSTVTDPRLILLKADKDQLGKKGALTQAILKAKNDILLFTDADCVPSSQNWIKSMTTSMVRQKQAEIVLGYGPTNISKGWLNMFIRYETILTAIQYLSYSVSGIPYMGVGRNLMYRKSLFMRNKGFESHKNIASGDDDLMISEVTTAQNTVVNLLKESFVYSDGKASLTSFLQQKSRHITTSVHYKAKHKYMLGLFAASQLGFYILAIILVIFGYISINVFVAIYLLKWIIQMILHHKSFEVLDGRDIRFWFPLMDIGMIIYYLVLPFYAFIRKEGW